MPIFCRVSPLDMKLVMGLSHVDDVTNLMVQGTSPNRRLELEPIQAVIMRQLALSRYGGQVAQQPRW